MYGSRRRAVCVVATLLAAAVIGCTDSSKPAALGTDSTKPASGQSAGTPWLLLDDPQWSVRKANDHPPAIPGLAQIWFVQYNSYLTPNTEASLVLAALQGDANSVLQAVPENVTRTVVLGHEAFVLESKRTDGTSAGTTLFWQDDSEVWMMLTGTSELTRDDVLALADRLVIVTDAQWHEAVAAKLFSS